jgi:hypothetical protein
MLMAQSLSSMTKMQFTWDWPSRDVERWLFSFQVLFLETFFVVPRCYHPDVHVLQFGIA